MGCVTPGRRAEQNSRKGAKPCERQKRREHGFAPVAVSYFCAVSSADRPAFGGRLIGKTVRLRLLLSQKFTTYNLRTIIYFLFMLMLNPGKVQKEGIEIPWDATKR